MVVTSIAAKQPPIIASSIVTFPVISVTRTIPVSGARTTPRKKLPSRRLRTPPAECQNQEIQAGKEVQKTGRVVLLLSSA